MILKSKYFMDVMPIHHENEINQRLLHVKVMKRFHVVSLCM